MPQFFIDRPIFAWVVAVFIVLFGVLALPRLPVERYPSIAPPSISVYAAYPGATPATLNDSVVAPIEREISGIPGLLYFESSADTSGAASITATFAPGTDPELAQVALQNRIRAVEPRLPQMVRQLGLRVESSAAGFLLIVDVVSPDQRYDRAALGDFATRNIVDEVKRIPGVGRVQSFSAGRAMRVWLDPARMTALGISVDDIANAIRTQNAQVSPGRVGDAPTVPGQRVTVPLLVVGELTSVEQFERVVLRASPSGAKVVLSDVARVELGSESYAVEADNNGVPSASMGVQLSPGANAVTTSNLIRERLVELNRALPEGVEAKVTYDTAPFVSVSIEKVVTTFFEAMLLVFAVMFLFLQNVRYTIIPAIVAPIAIMGTFAVMYVAGFSVNVLTMFGMVLAIGIIVDDAIVVVENVERIMAAEKLSPKDATRQAMREISGAVIGITLVLSAVFIPMALASGSVGAIYRQFSMSMAVSILFSAFLALSLTPALCATLLKPVDAHHDPLSQRGFFGWFNRAFAKLTARYDLVVGGLLQRAMRAMLVFVAVVVGTGFLFVRLPGSFLPEEDQGFWISSAQLPSDATAERTGAVLDRYRDYALAMPEVKSVITIGGFGFAGSGANSALAFTILHDWAERDGVTAQELVGRANGEFAGLLDGTLFNVLPPSIDG
ncbi:MAG TPA: efflux RND transporter permease subunit, partial [Myxococcota bacterium]